MKEGKTDLITGRIHWSKCPWFKSLSTHPFYYFTSFTLWVSGRSSFDLTDILLPLSVFYTRGIFSFLKTAAPFLALLSRHKSFLLSTRLWISLLLGLQCPHLSYAFSLHYLSYTPTNVNFVYHVASYPVENFSSPDHHCSNSDSCLPPSSSYFCLKNCPMKLSITLHQIFVCTSHPTSVQYIVSGIKKKKKSVVHKSGYHKYSLLGGGNQNK